MVGLLTGKSSNAKNAAEALNVASQLVALLGALLMEEPEINSNSARWM
jgi:hypothetical protein